MKTINQKAYNHAFKGIYGHIFLRFIGFCFIVFSQLAICYILISASYLLEGDSTAFERIDFEVIDYLIKLGNVGKPIIMCSLFALVFEKGQKIVHALIFYFVMALLFYIGEIIAFEFLLEPFVMTLLEQYKLDYDIVIELFPLFSTYILSYANLNVFLDMFLCTLIYLFLFYSPKFIKGKWMYAYRCLVILPFLYIIGSTVFSVLESYSVIEFYSIALSALFVKGSLPSFIIFTALVIFIKIRKNRYEKENLGLTYEEYLKTSSYTFSYSLFLAILLVVISAIELGLSYIPNINDFGFGNNYFLFLAVPFVLLFNVSKFSTKKWHRIVLPAFMTVHYTVFGISIAIVVVTILEFLAVLFGKT